jgi:hypothetical protein
MNSDLRDAKDTVLRMVSLHPTLDWYRQCLEMHVTADQLEVLQSDTAFLNEIKSVIFHEKQKLMQARRDTIEYAASTRGDWRGYDKLLQEIDSALFTVDKDTRRAEEDDETEPVKIYLPENNR